MNLQVLSLCSGIEAASVASEPFGWRFKAFSEIEAFPSAVLTARHPGVPNLGDFTEVNWSVWQDKIDIIVAGTPCQAFSVAGLRGGMADARGNLTLEFVRVCDAVQPPYIFWENVPGVLSHKDNPFGCFLGALCGEDDPLVAPGGRWTDAGFVLGPTRAIAWRTLDAQFFGLAQRRRRVFLICCPRDWSDPREILFEREGLRRDSPPIRETGERATGALKARTGNSGAGDNDARAQHLVASVAFGGNRCSGPTDLAAAVNAHGGPHGRLDFESETFVAHALQDPIYERDLSLPLGAKDTGHALAFSCKDSGADAGELAPTLRAMGHSGSHANASGQLAVAFAENSRGEVRLEGGDEPVAASLKTGGGKPGQSYPAIATAMRVRRLTPTECARLQGFPDDYLDILFRRKPAADGPKYKALGNSWAVPCVRWIFKRIDADAKRRVQEMVS